MQILTTFEPNLGRPAYPFTNDNNMSEVADDIAAFNADCPIKPNDCAVIVGTGGLLSLADLMPLNVYVTDRDPALLSWVQRCVGGLLELDSPVEFISSVKPPKGVLDEEKKILGVRQFLDSQASYDRARAAVGGLSIEYVDINYAKAGDVDELSDHLRQREQRVRIFNATNMHSHISSQHSIAGKYGVPWQIIDKTQYGESLSALPWADNYRIMASRGIPNSWPLLGSLFEYQFLIKGER